MKTLAFRHASSLTLVLFALGLFVSCSHSEENKSEQAPQIVQNEVVNTQSAERTITVPATPKVEVPDTYPLYPGCTQKDYEKRRACSISKLIDMLHRVVKHPDMRLPENKSGVVIHSFMVSEDGTMSDLKLERPLSPQCDEAAKNAIIEMFELSGPWEPATLDGKKVAARYSLPIQFQDFK